MEKVKKKTGNAKSGEGKGKFTKSTKVIYDERITVITEMLLSGLRRKEIVQNVSKGSNLNWNVTDRQIDHYIAEATGEILAQFEGERSKLINRIYAQYNFLYKKMVITKDYRAAAAVLEKICMFVNLKELIPVNDESIEIRQPVIVNITGRPQMHHYEDTIDSQEVTVIANQRLIS